MGGHVISFAEYEHGTWEERRAEAVERVQASWERYAPLAPGQVRAVWSQTPEDLERETGNIYGNPFHIDQTFHQMFGLGRHPRSLSIDARWKACTSRGQARTRRWRHRTARP